MRATVFRITCALLLGTAACTGSYGTANSDPPPDVIPVEAVKVTPQSIQFVAIGQIKQLQASVAPANATDLAVTWESTDSTVATVDAFGRVTARAAGGGVFITAVTRDGHFQSSANVVVTP